MATNSAFDKPKRFARNRANGAIAATVATLSVVLGALSCISWVGVGPFVADLGCWHYIAFTTILVTAIAAMSMDSFGSVPGSGFLTKLAVVWAAMFTVFAVGTALPSVESIVQPSVLLNVSYYAVMSLLFVAVAVFLQLRLTADTEVERQYRDFTDTGA